MDQDFYPWILASLLGDLLVITVPDTCHMGCNLSFFPRLHFFTFIHTSLRHPREWTNGVDHWLSFVLNKTKGHEASCAFHSISFKRPGRSGSISNT